MLDSSDGVALLRPGSFSNSVGSSVFPRLDPDPHPITHCKERPGGSVCLGLRLRDLPGVFGFRGIRVGLVGSDSRASVRSAVVLR